MDATAQAGAALTHGAAATPQCSGKGGERGARYVRVDVPPSGGTRESLLHVPRRYDPSRGAPLILNFHGLHSNAPEQEILTGMDAVSEARGLLVAYPQGTGSLLNKSWNAGGCCGEARTNGVDDLAFVRALIASIARDYCVDPKRIYAAGFSNGGFFAHRLGCEMSGEIAAIASVSGLLALSSAECAPSRPVPVIDFHGTADPVVIFGGGTGILGGANAPLSETIALWAQKDGCGAATTTTFTRGDTTCVAATGCAPGGAVVQCTIDGGGHTWPGGLPTIVTGKTTFNVNASTAIADFFEAHPLP